VGRGDGQPVASVRAALQAAHAGESRALTSGASPSELTARTPPPLLYF
jgi:hypothetical protein